MHEKNVTLFRLNDRQQIQIPKDHKIYNDVLVASIVNQDINSIVQKFLEKKYFCFLHWWPKVAKRRKPKVINDPQPIIKL